MELWDQTQKISWKIFKEIDIDEELIEDDEERVKLHNWLTDSENSDQSYSDC